MTRWSVIHGDLLDCKADGLICSANPHLNLSGGVGGAFALRYGGAMQSFLHSHLRELDQPFIRPGTAVLAPPSGSPFRAVSHGVSIDGFYETTTETIVQTYLQAFDQLAGAQCRSVVAACLGCGYGRVSASEFKQVIETLLNHEFPIESVSLGTTDEELADVIRDTLERRDLS